MVPRILIDAAAIPGGGELRLMRRGDDYQIMLGGNELMSSRVGGSEEALATLGCAVVPPAGRVLIGGLGMGFTLKAALAVLGPRAQVTVAELVPAVVEWCRGPLAHLAGESLADARMELFEGDVGQLIRGPAVWDAILLDVDNGPDGITHPGNDRLYGAAGLQAAWTALRPGGMLALWSSAPDPAFTRRLAKARFTVEEHNVRATGGRTGAHHIVWLARKG